MSVGLLSEAVLFSQEFLPAPHRPAVAATSGCPAGPNRVLKVGKVGANSAARFCSQHYLPGSAGSNLARSLLAERVLWPYLGIEQLDEAGIKAWMCDHLDRDHIFVTEQRGLEREIERYFRGRLGCLRGLIGTGTTAAPSEIRRLRAPRRWVEPTGVVYDDHQINRWSVVMTASVSSCCITSSASLFALTTRWPVSRVMTTPADLSPEVVRHGERGVEPVRQVGAGRFENHPGDAESGLQARCSAGWSKRLAGICAGGGSGRECGDELHGDQHGEHQHHAGDPRRRGDRLDT